jgi:hypothetical protein
VVDQQMIDDICDFIWIIIFFSFLMYR